MNIRISYHLTGFCFITAIILSTAACSSGSTTGSPTATIATTATPAAGVCNSTDFPTKTTGGPSEGFAYPPLTYYFDLGPAAGNHYYVLCSSGTPSTILSFLNTSIPAGGWTITSSTATAIDALKPTSPPSGFCYSFEITVGSHATYPGEWDADFHPPILSCGGTTPTVTPPTATPVPPTATPAPAAGVCNSTDFPTKTTGGPSEGFAYPSLTYYYDAGAGAGNHYYVFCSSGNPTSILSFLSTSIPAGGWTVTGTTATTLNAQKPTSPPSGFCYSVNITVGSHAGYPGEWDADFHPPALSC